MIHLFQPLKIRGIHLRNRLAVSPMCQYASEDGFANDWHLVHLGSRAVGGAGLVITEATAVSPQGRISPSDLGIWKDGHIEMLGRIARFIEKQGAVPGIQLAHAGRKASVSPPFEGNKLVTPEEGGWQIEAPSAIPFDEGYGHPREMSIDDIAQLKKDFAAAAKRAAEAGFRVIELHGAHGYLMHEFLSPLSNQRKDQYGGSLANRMRLIVELADAVREVWPEQHALFLRLSVTDWVEGGWMPDESVELARTAKSHGVDLIDCSSGGSSPAQTIPLSASYQVPFAERIRREAGIPTGAVGLITSPAQAESILSTGQADLVFMAREMLRDPYFPLRAADELGFRDMPWPVRYERAKRKR